MTFLTDLESIYTSEKIKQWSNAGNDTGATVANTTVIDAVERRVKGIFDKKAGVAYDELIDSHFDSAMHLGGVLLKTQAGEIGEFGEEWSRSVEEITELRLITHSDTITPEKQTVNKIPLEDLNESAFDTFTLFRNGFPPIRRNPPISSRNFMDNF